ncbi:MAG: 4-hydroxyphenylpyruvate dioxygenase, partial [Proteobacteria bacterium]|nr:4-hydroxyphenylpyruvate dioxygenase [Pseudomonadota bacterium]
ILGFEFIEFSAESPDKIHKLFTELGFSKLMRHAEMAVDYYRQGDIHFLVNTQSDSFSDDFRKLHGPCASATGWRVQDAEYAYETAVARGAKPALKSDYFRHGKKVPAIQGVGESLIYFIDDHKNQERYQELGFSGVPNPLVVPTRGFALMDHLTNNVAQGELKPLSEFYKNVFGFEEIRYFDIRGQKTGLLSFALRSPCGSFCVPINEGTEHKSQINEYLREYRGAGIQHIALLTGNLVKTMDSMSGSNIEMLDIDDEYYQEVFMRVPGVTEDQGKIRAHNLLLDGDESGYLLQIFSHNVIGPIFFEFIQRKNHLGFGEGNFGALFRAIERDQERRGVL